MRDPFEPFLRSQGFVLLDGALATELERRGDDLDDPLWSAKLLIEAPKRIEDVHYDYFRAGADVGTSASYQATFEGLARKGIEAQEAMRLLARSVELVKEARDRFWSEPSHRSGRLRPLVAASIGPYGAFLHDGSEYRGDYGLSRSELVEFHRRRLEVLAGAGADLLALETIPSLAEAEALLELLEELPEAPPAWIAFSCRNPRELSRGESFAEAVATAVSSDAILAVGVNCTHPSFVSGLLASAGDPGGKLLLAYPNSGELWDGSRHRWRAGPPSPRLEDLALDWYRSGARIIGGCCRTTPESIRGLGRALRSRGEVVTEDAPQGP